MDVFSENQLYNLDLKTDEQKSEYMLELARAKARFDAEKYYKNAIELRDYRLHIPFILSGLMTLVSSCIGFLLGEITK